VKKRVILLDFHRSHTFELLTHGFGFFLAHVFLDRLGGAIDQVFGFLQAERSNFPYRLDGVDLVRARILEDDGELGLLFDRRGCGCAAPAGNGYRGPAAAETPNRSSSFLTRAAASSRLKLTI